jgi:alcohol dehydrogenase (cytochrome c)
MRRTQTFFIWSTFILAVLLFVSCQQGASNGAPAKPAAQQPVASVPAPTQAVTYQQIPTSIDLNVTDSMLQNASNDTHNWLTYGHDYTSDRYVNLNQINASNVASLRPVYAVQTGIADGFETTPIVVNGVMFFTTSDGPQVWAVNAATGDKYWVYTWPQPQNLDLCCGPVNRGVAVAYGKVFFTTLDAHLVALDARTGKLLWDKQLADTSAGYSDTVAPLVYQQRVIVGIAGAEYGIKGWIRSYSADNGELQWQFNTVDYSKGWGSNQNIEGGGSTWMTGSIDQSTNTLFWNVGNPSPDFNGNLRPGDNLYTESTVALDVATGNLKWYYQYTPHDIWDYDSVTPSVLITAHVNGQNVPALEHCDKNGYCYTLRRDTGQLIVQSQEFVKHMNYKANISQGGTDICPGPSGGTEWLPISYYPANQNVYVSGINNCAHYTTNLPHYVKGQAYWGSAFVPQVGNATGTFTAINVNTGKVTWQYQAAQPMVGGALTTSGGLVFTGEQNGYVEAFNSENGKKLWSFNTGAGIHAPPSSFTINGKEYIAVAAGDGGWTAGFGAVGAPNHYISGGQLGDALFVFALS